MELTFFNIPVDPPLCQHTNILKQLTQIFPQGRSFGCRLFHLLAGMNFCLLHLPVPKLFFLPC